MIDAPKVCIIIVNWNKKDYVTDLIESLRRMSYKNYDTVVVDNASTDGSIEAIKNFPEVHLICNPNNLGGTGGFNAGMRFALEQNCYEYIWLLDNDARVMTTTLSELVKVAENDPEVGVAGSMIVNPDIQDLVVEFGGYISWENRIWKPYMRNEFIPPEGLPSTVEVDYVAACSALVRMDAIQQTGIMDERYFIHWDDIDFCLRIWEAGYKVVAVSNSMIYHEVEKESNPVLVYYDIRNGLLTMAKHLKRFQRIIAIYNTLRESCKIIVLSYFTNLYNISKLIINSLTDFFKGRFYRINKSISSSLMMSEPLQFDVEKVINYCDKRMLILPSGSATQISKTLEKMESLGCNNLFLLIEDDRKHLFSYTYSDRIISFNNRRSNLNYLKLLIKIAAGQYAFAVSPTSIVLPYSYAVKNCIYFDSESEQFYQSKETMKCLWKLAISFFAGELIALALLPIFYFKSKKYYINRSYNHKNPK